MEPWQACESYSDMVIATRGDDSGATSDTDGWSIYAQSMVLLYSFIGTWVGASIMCYMLADYVPAICFASIIGLGFWLCKHYGTNRSVLDRFRYRKMSPAERIIVQRRLSGK